MAVFDFWKWLASWLPFIPEPIDPDAIEAVETNQEYDPPAIAEEPMDADLARPLSFYIKSLRSEVSNGEG